MENFDDKNLMQTHASAPEGMYDQVRARIIQERIKMVKTRRQLAIGSALLLIVGVMNVGIILFYNREKPKKAAENPEKTLYESYFDNQMTLYNEK